MGTNKAEEILEKHNSVNGIKVKGNVVWKHAAINAMEEYRQSEIDELTKEVERLRVLNKRLFTLWESLYEVGEISIGKNFSKSFNEIRELINK